MTDQSTRDSGFLERTRADTLPPDPRGGHYRPSAYPWSVEPSDYEAQKYDEMLLAFSRARYKSVFEVGCLIGPLTQRLTERCDSLLAVDCSPIAPKRVVTGSEESGLVRLDRVTMPREPPNDTAFDLVVLSEVAYHWSWHDLRWVFDRIGEQLVRGGHLVLVHWAPPGPGQPLSGVEVHGAFMQWAEPTLHHLFGRHEGPYWIDLFERSQEPARRDVSRYSTILNSADGDSTNPQEW